MPLSKTGKRHACHDFVAGYGEIEAYATLAHNPKYSLWTSTRNGFRLQL